MSKPCKFRVGDIVRHKSSFLHSVGWYTNVPKNGRVTSIEPHFGPNNCGLLHVEWNDYLDPCGILACNVEPCPIAKRAKQAEREAIDRLSDADNADARRALGLEG